MPREEDDDAEPTVAQIWLRAFGKKARSRETVGSIISILFHLLILFLLSHWMFREPNHDGIGQIEGGFNEILKVIAKNEGNLETDIQLDNPTGDEAEKSPTDEKNENKTDEIVQQEVEPMVQEVEAEADSSIGKTENAAPSVLTGETEAAPTAGRRWTNGFISGGGYGGRNGAGRSGAVGGGDCSGAGEDAVEFGLAWFAKHQDKDGGWRFDLATEGCKQCSNGPPKEKIPHMHGSRIAATALALLPFLGAGYTHETGKYRTVVEDGLAFLLVNGVPGDGTLSFSQGYQGMYSHGLATIVLCEAHAMSKKKLPRLQQGAQNALRFIENAQDRRTGGWRYTPNASPGDLSVSAWQIMALKSGKLANLHVSLGAVYLAADFIESVSMEGGRRYNYLPDRGLDFVGSGDDSPQTCTATGLLMRMYLGWAPGEKMLDQGIDELDRLGPLRENGEECCLYYAYYATLAMHHYDGSAWARWSKKMRGFLVETQSKKGHEAGSWYFPDPHADKAGRLMNTSLAILILETPYRILPLYRKR